MEGMAQFFATGGNSIPVSPDEIQLVSLIGFLLVGLVYSCGTLNRNPERILERMIADSEGHPEMSKAAGFVADALKKHPVDTYGKWFLDRSQFPDLARHFSGAPIE